MPILVLILALAFASPAAAEPHAKPLPFETTRSMIRPVDSARLRLLHAMDSLRSEIQTLTSLRDTQSVLLAWNRERQKTGLPPATLNAGLCRDLPVWCSTLPATFGTRRVRQ